MIRTILRRAAAAIVLAVLAASFSFVVLRWAPGSPFEAGRHLAPEIEEHLRRAWHLDAPLWRQWLDYVVGLAHGDLGPSLRRAGLGVSDILREHFPVSLALGGLAITFAFVFGVGLGALAAARHGQWPDRLIAGLGHVVVGVPAFVLGPLLVFGLSLELGWLPPADLHGPASWVLPALTLSLGLLAAIARLVRSGFLEVLGQSFIRTARAKGLGEATVLFRHALRPGILPALVFLGPAFADVVTGSVVVERVFGVPGLGAYFVDAALNRDYTVLAGVSFFYCLVVITSNLAVDLATVALDPRLRRGAT